MLPKDEATIQPTYFDTPGQFREWLEAHHDTARELWVGYYRKGSGKQGMTWAESVDQALCFGWIDSIRKRVDDTSYMNRFTPRKSRSIWSAANIARVGELTEMGLMRPAGLRAFEQRTERNSAIYSYEQVDARLDAEHEARFRADERAWAFFDAQAPWYRKAAIRWVTTARRENTRLKRLATLIECSAQGRTIQPLTGDNRGEQ